MLYHHNLAGAWKCCCTAPQVTSYVIALSENPIMRYGRLPYTLISQHTAIFSGGFLLPIPLVLCNMVVSLQREIQFLVIHSPSQACRLYVLHIQRLRNSNVIQSLTRQEKSLSHRSSDQLSNIQHSTERPCVHRRIFYCVKDIYSRIIDFI